MDEFVLEPVLLDSYDLVSPAILLFVFQLVRHIGLRKALDPHVLLFGFLGYGRRFRLRHLLHR